MEVADTVAVMHEGRIEQTGAPRDVYDQPATDFVMGFLGPAVKLDGQLVRPHDLKLTLEPGSGAIEAMVKRVVHLGFEVRIELELSDGTTARAQLTRSEANQLEVSDGDIVYVRPPMEIKSEPSGVTTTSVGAKPWVPIGSRKTSGSVRYEAPSGWSGRK